MVRELSHKVRNFFFIFSSFEEESLISLKFFYFVVAMLKIVNVESCFSSDQVNSFEIFLFTI